MKVDPPPPKIDHINFFVLEYVSDDLESNETNFFFFNQKKLKKFSKKF